MALFLLRRSRSIRLLDPGLFKRGMDGGVVGFQHFLFPFQSHIDISASKFMETPSDAPIPARVKGRIVNICSFPNLTQTGVTLDDY